MRARGVLKASLIALVLAGCAADQAPVTSPMRPKGRPVYTPPPPPSAQSVALAQYYAAVQAEQLSRGLMRTDGGGADTPYSDRMLAENFIRIALYDEYARDANGFQQAEVPSRLRRWTQPVRVGLVFGPSTAPSGRGTETARIASYLARLSRITGHPIQLVPSGANFRIFILNEDERRAMAADFAKAAPNLTAGELQSVVNLPRETYCLVYASGDGATYTNAVALIRAEHPNLMSLACLHEEVAQGLGLANDSPQARPSVFNDDDEFAFLTVMDEQMLRILYDPRLKPGMAEAEARPIVEAIATEMVGGSS